MNVGVLLDAAGKVKRTWAIVSGECAVPLDDGDEVVHFATNHGQDEADPIEQQRLIDQAIKLQEDIATCRARNEVLTISAPFAEARHCRRYVRTGPPEPGREIMYRSDGNLASRAVGDKKMPTTDIGHEKHGQLLALNTP